MFSPSIVRQHSVVVMQEQVFDLRHDRVFPVVQGEVGASSGIDLLC